MSLVRQVKADFVLTCCYRCLKDHRRSLLRSASVFSLSLWSASPALCFYIIISNPHILLFPVTWSPEKVSQTSPPSPHLVPPPPLPDSRVSLFPSPRPPLASRTCCSLLGRRCQRSTWKDLIGLIPLNLSTPAFSFRGDDLLVSFQVHVRCWVHMWDVVHPWSRLATSKQ